MAHWEEGSQGKVAEFQPERELAADLVRILIVAASFTFPLIVLGMGVS